MKSPRQLTWLAAPFLLVAQPAIAEVTEVSDTGFTTTTSGATQLSASDVWSILVRPEEWWSGEHTWSGNSRNLTLAAEAGGCLCETLPAGGSAEHMRVLYAQPGKLLRLSGALGPLQGEALVGTLTIELDQRDGTTHIEWTYVVGGHARFPLKSVAPAVDGVMSEQLNRLLSLIQFGDAGHLSDD